MMAFARERRTQAVQPHSALGKGDVGNDTNQLTSVFSNERVLKNIEMKF